MSTLSERWRNTSTIFRVLLLVLLVVLLVLLCLLVFLQFVLPVIRPTPPPTTPTTPVPTAMTPTGTATPTQTPVAPEASMTPTNTPVVRTETPGVTTETPIVTTETPATTKTVPATTVVPTSVTPTAVVTPVIKIRNVLRNGGFEGGFQPNELGHHWQGFNNGNADFSFHIDDWPLVVPEGEYAQLIEIKNAQEPDRYFGIYQTARVIPGEDYDFSMQGLVRTNTGDVDKTSYGYRMQVGFDLRGGQDWEKVDEWVELQWDEQLRVQDSFRFDVYTTTLTAHSNRLTVFVRAWKKWADSGEGDYDVDDIQLVGPALVAPPSPAIPETGDAPGTVWDNIQIWATVALLLLLVTGALWRLGWKRR